MALVKLKLTKKSITGKLEISNLSEKMLELNMRPMFTDSQVPRKDKKKTTHKIDKQLFFRLFDRSRNAKCFNIRTLVSFFFFWFVVVSLLSIKIVSSCRKPILESNPSNAFKLHD